MPLEQKVELDEVDRSILDALRRDPRASVVRLAGTIRKPRTTVAERLKRLEKSNIIRGYALRVNHELLGFHVTAFVFVRRKPEPEGWDPALSLPRRLAALDGVEEVNLVQGEWDLLIKVRAHSERDLFERVLGGIRKQKEVERTLTMSCFISLTKDG